MIEICTAILEKNNMVMLYADENGQGYAVLAYARGYALVDVYETTEIEFANTYFDVLCRDMADMV